MRLQALRGGLAGAGQAQQQHQQQPARSVAARSMGGRGRGGFGGDSPLILGPGGGPMGGRGAPQGGPGRLILPGSPGQFQPGRGGGRPPIGLADDPAGGGGTLPAPNKFRPPPGFMNADARDPALDAADPQEMLSRLRSRGGAWHALAKLLPVLYAKGLDTNMVFELSGINPVDQNRWVVAGTVYDSIASTGQVPGPVLAFFDQGGDQLLYHFRFLPAERRASAAQFIAANALDEAASEVLARAMKEWDRRPGEREGFSDSPGDCLAFKYLRDAIECRFAEEAAEKLQLALDVAETDGARQRLEEWRESELAAAEEAATSFASKAAMTVFRLSQDEMGFRPMAQVSRLEDLGQEELLAAPSTSQEGAFGAFDMPATSRGHKWVALPQWKTLALARHPVAIPLADCSAEPSVLAACRAKTDEDRKRLAGTGLLVVDIAVGGPIDPNSFYVVRSSSGARRLAVVEGAKLVSDGAAAVAPVAAVLFLCRPPLRESALTSAELLQL